MTEAGRPFSAAGRTLNLADLAAGEVDILVVGGGITGAGVALQATQRGLRVGLVEAHDFGSGTSSRSSKLIHGGIRYLAHGEVGLVHEALQERRRLRGLFPALVEPLPFLMPIPRRRRTAAQLAAGFWAYDLLALGSGFPRHHRVGIEEARRRAPALQRSDIRGAWLYWDARTDDARLTLEVVRRAAAGGALVANHARLVSARREAQGWLAQVRDELGGEELQVRCRYLINASGAWADQVEALAEETPHVSLRPSKGVHLSFSSRSLPLECALIFPAGQGRVLFAVPWKGHVIVGTTDDAYEGDIDSPGCTEDEEAFVLAAVNHFFQLQLPAQAVLSRWAGVRPLVAGGRDAGSVPTRDLSRKPYIRLDRALLTVTGGKLTTFWRMGEEVLDLLPGASRRGAAAGVNGHQPLPDREASRDLVAREPGLAQALPGDAGYLLADVARACDEEMAMELGDVLSRRLRLTFLDAAAARAAAPAAARVMAARLGWSEIESHLRRFEDHLDKEFTAIRQKQLA